MPRPCGSTTLADQLASRNRTFGELQRSYRYLEFDSEADDARAQEDDVKAPKAKMKADDARAQEDDGKPRKGGLRSAMKNLVHRGRGR